MSATPPTATDAMHNSNAPHALSVAQTLAQLETSEAGLTEAEAARRRARHGPNRLRPPPRRPAWLRLFLQVHNVLIYVLLGASLVTALLGHWIDTAVIFGVVVINSTIGFIQEGRAERAMEAIERMLSPSARVLRDDKKITRPAAALVPGDIVFLQSGDNVPADLRLIHVKSLQTQEAVLTGESLTVEKNTAAVEDTTELGERAGMAYSGTLVTYGQALGVVVATGEATEIGRVSSMLAKVKALTTPLLHQLGVFGRWLTVAIIALTAAIFAFGMLVRHYALDEMFLAAVGLAVAAIPEGLPAVMTITLAIGVQRMARRKAIIRRLHAVETLGSVTVICSDKTGTLTRNEMTVQSLATSRHRFDVSGVGYAPAGDFMLDGAALSPQQSPRHWAFLSEMTRAALLCSDARVYQDAGQWAVDGDPTEGALVVLAMKAGHDPEFESKARPRTDVIPFESEHRFMATLHHDHTGAGFIFAKGAPERILDMCSRQVDGDGKAPLDRDYWQQRIEEMAESGQRVLALAMKPATNHHRELRFSDVETDLALVGLLGLADPPREEAVAAVARCRGAGIQVKMITGDHAGTARAVARALGFANADIVLTGKDLDGMADAQFAQRIQEVDVFARTSPAHKLRLVEALQEIGHVVAMTGDGVNDAPALKRADIGVAMGLAGTDAAKEAAEMVLADDNFATISRAVEEGRTIYDNLRKSAVFILPTSGGEALTIAVAIGFGGLLAITPVQILWVNMITAVTLSLALAFEAGEKDVMRRAPRGRAEPILSGFLVWRISFVALIMVAGIFGIFSWELARGAALEYARTAAVNTLVGFEIFYLFSSRYLRGSSFSVEGVFGSRPVLITIAIVIGLQIAFTYAPPLQFLFQTEGLDAFSWVKILVISSLVFVLVEIEKRAVNHVGSRPAAG